MTEPANSLEERKPDKFEVQGITFFKLPKETSEPSESSEEEMGSDGLDLPELDE